MKKLLFIMCITCVPHFIFANTDSLSDRMKDLQETGIENAGNPQILATYNKLKETINKRENLQTEYLSALSDNADAMKENEQRIENKVLGSTGIGAIGIGGMQLASGLSEQNADQDAETAMRAYLSTFSCDYNDTQNFTGGETNITLPAINLIELKSEYLTLATSLKERKNALELPLGIESQEILDSATAGLYDDISTGKSDGAFTSLSAALMSPSGTDATEWAAQKEASSEKIKTGATLAGVGAVASIAGNLIINKDAPKERSNEITREYKDNIANIDQEISEQQSELDKLITENENIIDNYNQELQQHINFVETITESDCIEQFREYIDYINSLSPITNSYADTSSLEIPYTPENQRAAYQECVNEAQLNQKIQECSDTPNYEWVDGECVKQTTSTSNYTDTPTENPKIEETTEEETTEEETTTSDPQQEQTEEEPQIPDCPATGNGLSTINETSILGASCTSDIISEGYIAKKNDTCTCVATGCIISHEVKGGRCVKKAEADDDNIEDTNKYVDENGFCTSVTLTYVWTKAPNQTIQQSDISEHFNQQCDRHAEIHNCKRTDFNTSRTLTNDDELLEVEWMCNATSDDYMAAKERINKKYSNLKYQNFCTTKDIKKNQMTTLTSGAKASCITFFDEYSIPDYETQLVLAQTYMKQKVSAEEQFYSTTNACQTADKRTNRTDGRTGQYLNCNTLDDKVRFTFSFFNTPNQQNKKEKTSPDTLMDALCDIFGVQKGKQQNKNPYCSYAYNRTDSSKDEICNKIDHVVQNFGYRANIVPGTGCVLDPSGGLAGEKAKQTGMKSDQKIKDNKLRTFYDLDNYMFSNISTNMDEWLYDQLHIIVQKEMQNKGHRDKLVEFKCDPTKAFVMDSRNVLTCTANGHPIDFVFKQLGKTSKRRANASQEGLTCIFGQNGKYDGEHCWGLTKEKCTQLDRDIKQSAGSECPSCGAKWNDTDFTPGACVLTKSTKIKKTDRTVEIGVGVTLTVGSAVLTVFSGGATSELLVFTAAETTGLIWSAVQDKKIGKVADQFMAKVQHCKDATCAQELLTNEEVERILNLESDLDDDQVKTIDDKLAELIGYLPADSELAISLAVTMANKTKCNFWKNLTYQCEPEQFYKAVAEVLTFASLFWSVGRSTVRFIKSHRNLTNLVQNVAKEINFSDAKYLDDEAKNLKRAQEALKKNPSRSEAQQLRTKITKHKQNIQTRKNKLGITDDATLAVAKADAYKAHDIDLAHQDYDNLLKKRNEWDNYMKNHNGNPPQNVGKKEIENLNNQIAQAEKKLTNLGETVQPAKKLELPTVAPKTQTPDFDKLSKQADRNFNGRLNSFKNGKPQNLTKKNLNDDQWKQLSDHLEGTEGIRIVETNKNGTTFMSFEKVDNAASITNKSDDIAAQIDDAANKIDDATNGSNKATGSTQKSNASDIETPKNKVSDETDDIVKSNANQADNAVSHIDDETNAIQGTANKAVHTAVKTKTQKIADARKRGDLGYHGTDADIAMDDMIRASANSSEHLGNVGYGIAKDYDAAEKYAVKRLVERQNPGKSINFYREGNILVIEPSEALNLSKKTGYVYTTAKESSVKWKTLQNGYVGAFDAAQMPNSVEILDKKAFNLDDLVRQGKVKIIEPKVTKSAASAASKSAGKLDDVVTISAKQANASNVATLRQSASNNFDKYLADVKTNSTGKGAKLPKKRLNDAGWNEVNKSLAGDNVQLVDTGNGYMQFVRADHIDDEVEVVAKIMPDVFDARKMRVSDGSGKLYVRNSASEMLGYPVNGDDAVSDVHQLYETIRRGIEYPVDNTKVSRAINAMEKPNNNAILYRAPTNTPTYSYDWHVHSYNGPRGSSSEVRYHVSLNVEVDDTLIKKLDDIMTKDQGRHIVDFKIPPVGRRWKTMADPISIYMRGTNPEIERAIAEAAKPYVRTSSEIGLLGRKIDNGVAIAYETSAARVDIVDDIINQVAKKDAGVAAKLRAIGGYSVGYTEALRLWASDFLGYTIAPVIP